MTGYIWGTIGAVAVGGLVIIIRKLQKKNARKKEMAIQAGDKLREEALDRIILNSSQGNNHAEIFSAQPFEVNYDANAVGKQTHMSQKKKNSLMVQIVENSELSARKYMFDPKQGIRIGSRQGKNNITVSHQDVDEIQCEILENAGRILVRNAGGSGKVIIKRGRKQAYVEKAMIELKSGDVILIGNMSFKVDIIKAAN